MMTGFLLYLTPIYLTSLGNDQAVIGRVLMCYGLAALFITPVSDSLFRSTRSAIIAVGSAVMLQGLAVLFLLLRSDTIGMAISITVFGLAQAIAGSLQTALVPTLAQRETEMLGNAAVLSVYRLIERMGTVIGPFLVALLLSYFGHQKTFAMLGVGMTVCGALFIALLSLLFVQRYQGAETHVCNGARRL